MSFILSNANSFAANSFKITVEVVPPAGYDIKALMEKILPVSNLNFHGFSVASNPVARPRMSAMVFSHLLQRETGKPAILHFTVRDHNRLGLQAELWGAKALGIETIIAVTGDPSAKTLEHPAATVNDMNVCDLISMAEASGMCAGAVLDYRPEVNGLDHEIKRIDKKVRAGCRFIVTQPVYDPETALGLKTGLDHIKVPVIMGILPLISIKHALFLHHKVDGIAIPEKLQQTMKRSRDPLKTGLQNSREMLELAEKWFSGACVMPPFDRFDILSEIL